MCQLDTHRDQHGRQGCVGDQLDQRGGKGHKYQNEEAMEKISPARLGPIGHVGRATRYFRNHGQAAQDGRYGVPHPDGDQVLVGI